jgi:hypothetical protein
MSGWSTLLKTLRGEPVDRVPIAPFLYFDNVYEMFDHFLSIDCLRTRRRRIPALKHRPAHSRNFIAA